MIIIIIRYFLFFKFSILTYLTRRRERRVPGHFTILIYTHILLSLLKPCNYLAEPTVVDTTVDDRTGRREETHHAHVQANVDHQHEHAVDASQQHFSVDVDRGVCS